MPASFSLPDERPVSLPYCEGDGTRQRRTRPYGSIIGKSLRFSELCGVSPLMNVRQGACDSPGFIPTASAFLWGMD